MPACSLTLYDYFTGYSQTMKRSRKITFLFLTVALLPAYVSCGQDSVNIDFLINRIAAWQTQENTALINGLFPSYIADHEKFSDKKADHNIFYNGLIAYTLTGIKDQLNQKQQQRIDALLQNAKPAFDRFRNQKGRSTYNFWRTDTAFHYPYIGLVNLFMKKTALPDDMDDTVLSLLALSANDSTAKDVHRLMQQYVNNDSNKVHTIIKGYEQYPAYSTWFGKKFPVVFDVSVMCNVLSFVQHYNLPWTKADSACLDVIAATIKEQYHIGQPIYASPYYPKTALILYHVARLMAVKPIPALEALKPRLIEQAGAQLKNSNNRVEQMILALALLKWGADPPPVALPPVATFQKEIEQNNYAFFAGNVPSYFSDWLRVYASNSNRFIYYHYCPAFNDALLLEYLVLSNKHS